MAPKTIILFASATILGLVAVIVARIFLAAPPAGAPVLTVAPASADAVVASVAIPAGTTIAAAQLKQVALPAATLPAGVFASVAAAVGKGSNIALRQIDANELVLAKAISGGDSRLSTSGAITAQMRAVAIRVSDVAGVGGLLAPGDRVDIMITRTIQGQLGGPVSTAVQTDLIVQNARVLAVDQDTGAVKPEADKGKVPATVTVEVAVEQAQKLALAQTVGTISLMLRDSSDLASAASRTIRLSDLHAGGALPVYRPRRHASSAHRWTPRAVPATHDVEVVRGMTAQRYPVKASQ